MFQLDLDFMSRLRWRNAEKTTFPIGKYSLDSTIILFKIYFKRILTSSCILFQSVPINDSLVTIGLTCIFFHQYVQSDSKFYTINVILIMYFCIKCIFYNWHLSFLGIIGVFIDCPKLWLRICYHFHIDNSSDIKLVSWNVGCRSNVSKIVNRMKFCNLFAIR